VHFGSGPSGVWVTCCADPTTDPGPGAQPEAGTDTASSASTASTASGASVPGSEVPGSDPEPGRLVPDGDLFAGIVGVFGGSTGCYCRRTVAEFHAEALAQGAPATGGAARDAGNATSAVVQCVTCGELPAEDTQCRPCREERQHAAQRAFAERQARVVRAARRRR
jgi:hypothetical protein